MKLFKASNTHSSFQQLTSLLLALTCLFFIVPQQHLTAQQAQTAAPAAQDADADIISIPDRNLLHVLVRELNIPDRDITGAPGDITRGDMKRLTSLTANSKKLSDLSGLEAAVNLSELSLSDNTLSNLTPLSNLTGLTTLNLINNQISDIAPLSNLTSLTTLSLGDNQISDIAPLTNLTNLERLFLERNQITDVSSLTNLTNLKWLFLESNQITDVSSLGTLTKLTHLSINHNYITDFSPLDKLVDGLTEFVKIPQRTAVAPPPSIVSTPDQTIVSIPDPSLSKSIKMALFPEALSGAGPSLPATVTQADMARLTFLHAGHLGITDLTGLEAATNLDTLLLTGNQIANLQPLANLTKLIELYLDFNAITSVEHLTSLTNLNTLILAGNQISDVSPLASLTNLTRLNLSGNQISDFSSLAALESKAEITRGSQNLTVTVPDQKLWDVLAKAIPSREQLAFPNFKSFDLMWLTNLDAPGAGITDLTGLEYATNLTRLRLVNNQISDLSPLSGLTNLQHLVLINNQIQDVSPLANLTNLQVLGISRNYISDFSPLADLVDQLSNYQHTPQANERVYVPDANLRNAISSTLGVTLQAPGGLGRHKQFNGSDILRLTTLDASGAGIVNLSGLEYALNLTSLNLSNNQIVDVSPLANLRQLTHLNLSGNGITDLSPLAGLESQLVEYIKAFSIPDANLRAAVERRLGKASGDPIAATDMEKLDYLIAYSSNITSLTGLEAATNMRWLFLSDNAITDLSPLSGVTSLQWLDLRQNDISNLSPLSGLTGLGGLGLSDNEVSDVSPLAGLTGLQYLMLDRNRIGDFSPIDDIVGQLVSYTNSGQRVDPEVVMAPNKANRLSEMGLPAELLEMMDFRFLSEIEALFVPERTDLLANYPNPFNPETWIPYQLATPAEVSVSIYNVSGRLIRTLDLGHQAAGFYRGKSRAAYWDGRNAFGERVSSGVYFYVLTAGDFAATRKMLILK